MDEDALPRDLTERVLEMMRVRLIGEQSSLVKKRVEAIMKLPTRVRAHQAKAGYEELLKRWALNGQAEEEAAHLQPLRDLMNS
ncbi:hypothetical protein DL765_011578 [Monosporascus sp. GIB2]|nr:hypothetical protein DL765_011578 [Monosporascus sp. GIB2]